MNAWLKVLDKLGSGTPMLQGYVATTQGLRLLGSRARPPGSTSAALRRAGTATNGHDEAREPQSCG